VPTSTDSYPAGALYKTITSDENGKQTITYTDKEERVIFFQKYSLRVCGNAIVISDYPISKAIPAKLQPS
jgi:hypothetical protein